MANTASWYNQNATSLATRYESLSTEEIHCWLLDLWPESPATVLDIGAGTGRDAAWLAAKGYEVVAVEPSAAMRQEANRLHPDAAIRWIDDSLPGLATVSRSGLSFDFVLLSAVWMHVSPNDRARTFRKIVNLLKPGGILAMSLRHGDSEKDKGIHPISLSEVEKLARDHGLMVERKQWAEDHFGRSDVYWTHVAVRVPDDGAGALPLLRHVILNDDKSSTYKLALLRTLCRIADGASGLSRDHDDGFVSVPLGLVALTWIRLFKPLLAADLPQSPQNHGYQALSFVKEPFVKMKDVPHTNLRIGMTFSGLNGLALMFLIVYPGLKD